MGIFGFTFGSPGDTELPDIFPMIISQKDFVQLDAETIYSRILIDVLERTEGITDEIQYLLWDNCMASETCYGLVSLLSKAMVNKEDLFIVYDKAVKILRKADSVEESQIREGYKAKGESEIGVYVTFKNYCKSDMVKLYSALEYCGVNSFWKSMNVSKAVQLKFSDLRSSAGLIDASKVEGQGMKIAQGLSQGKDIMLDAKDSVDTAKPDLTATEAAMDLIAQKRSFYLGMPASYITGLSKNSLGDTGEGDKKAKEMGFRSYYFSIVKPVLENLFDISTSFMSEDFRQLDSANNTLKVFSITDDVLISEENKREILNTLYGLEKGTLGDAPEEQIPLIAPPLPAPGGVQPSTVSSSLS